MSKNLYNNPEPDKLIKTTENQNFEKKSARIQSKDLANKFSAFANSSIEGGLVVLGIENDHDLIGINKLGQSKINDLISAHNIFCPEVKIKHKKIDITNIQNEADKLLIFFVEFSANKVIKLNSGEAYERIADQTCKMTPEKIRLLEYDKGQADFEKEFVNGLSIGNLNAVLMQQYIDQWIERDGLTTNPTLENLITMQGFGQNNNGQLIINYAGVLLFHDHPEKFLSGAKIRFLRYEGTQTETGSRSNIIKDKYFEGPLPKQIEEVSKMIKSQIREFSFLDTDGKFKTVLEYPEFAWFEAIVNALVHRAYNLKHANIFIRMFDDRIEIESPGNLPGIVTINNIYNVSFPRNPILMQAMLYLGYVKAASEGVDRIKDEMLLLGLPEPQFQNDSNAVQFRITLHNNIKQRSLHLKTKDLEKLDSEKLEKLGEDERRIIYYILRNNIGAPSELEKEINKKRATVVRKLRNLEKLQFIMRTTEKGPKVKYILAPNIFTGPQALHKPIDKNEYGKKQPKLL